MAAMAASEQMVGMNRRRLSIAVSLPKFVQADSISPIEPGRSKADPHSTIGHRVCPAEVNYAEPGKLCRINGACLKILNHLHEFD